MENNEVIGWAVIGEADHILTFQSIEEAEKHGIPIPIVHVEEVKS